MLNLLLLATFSVSEPQWQRLPNSQTEIRLLAPASAQAPLLVVAPGQSCNARRPLFEAIESAARAQGIGLLRLEWSYCANPEGQRRPSADYAAERQDIERALSWASAQASLQKRQLLLAGKSMGSLVSYQVFQQSSQLKGLGLLTPVCSYDSDEQGQPLNPPLNQMSENYPELAKVTRPTLISLGSQDSLCHLPYLYQAIQASQPNLSLQIFGGGHSLQILNAQNQENAPATARNLAAFANSLINWAWGGIEN